MGLGHLSEDGVHAAVLIALLGVLLHLEDEARVAQRLDGGEIGREGGQRLTIAEALVLDVGVVGVLYLDVLNVVVEHHHAVACDVHVKL